LQNFVSLITTVIRNNIEDIYQLSPIQQGILFHCLYAPEDGVYFEQLSCALHGNLNVLAFEQAWQQVLTRHQALRTAFIWEHHNKPLQVVYQLVKLPLEIHDWRGLSIFEQQQRLETFLQSDRERGFKLSEAPLMRLTLIQVDSDVYQFVWSHHHLLMDAWSLSLVLKKVFAFYKAFSQCKDSRLELSHSYRDYILWLQKQDLAKAEVFWRQELKGFTAPTPLVVDRAGGSGEQGSYSKQQIQLSVAATEALQSLARQHQLTLNTLVQGAWALLLNRYSGEADVVFGATVSGRSAAIRGVESIVGLLINTLPMRVQVAPEDSLLSWLKQIQNRQVEMSQYEYSSLLQIQGWSEVPRGVPLFESIVVFENYTVNISLQEQGGNLRVRDFRSCERTNYPLTVVAVPGAELSLQLGYDCHRFDGTTIARMLGHFKTLLTGMMSNPNQRLSELPLLTAAERHQMLVKWNDTHADYPLDVCIHQLFEAQVEQTPDAVAVVFEDQQLTYRELNSFANQLAHHLSSMDVGPDVLVGICMERSLEMMIGLLGILKAGGAYVPLDPAYPQERLAFMLEDADVPVLLTQQHLVFGLPEQGAKVVCLDTDGQANAYCTALPNAQQSQSNPVSSVKPNNLAYVIYTSGSTGRPKGVAMTHRPLSNLLSWQLGSSTLKSEAKTLQFAPISFDVSFQEIFSTWCSGGTLVLILEEVRRDAVGLLRFLSDKAVERLFLPFVALQLLAEVADAQGAVPKSLREVISAGEQLQITKQIANWFSKLEGCTLHNQYGPSESHVVTAFTLTGSPSDWPALPPIGCPIANTRCILLDAQMQLVPVGIPGELYIGGVGLARGYLNRPDLTAERFIPNPFSDQPGTYLYKTGDLARYLPNGNIEYIGRIDYQVKLRGFRIELGEIEAMLGQHPAVRGAVVMDREDVPSDKRLVAYVVPNHEQTPIIDELRRFLKQKLPDYMVPSAFVLLDALPLTPNNKIDRRALPAPDRIRQEPEETFVVPRDELELQLTKIWEKVLGIQPIGVRDNFFALGGYSLLAVRLFVEIEKALNKNLPLAILFQTQTIEQLANILRQQEWLPPWSSLVPINLGGSKRPFFCVHPGGGNVLCYTEFASYIGSDQPFYGLQAQGLDGQKAPYSRIEDMAAHYIREVRTLQPEGPYLLGGFCLGGLVAFEMSQQLQAQDQKVTLLVMLDPTPPPELNSWGPLPPDSEKNTSYYVSRLIYHLQHSQLAQVLVEKVKSWITSMCSLEYRRLSPVLEAHARAVISYRPQVYPGRITLFQSSEFAYVKFPDCQHKWSELAVGGIDYQVVPGIHKTMLQDPCVQIWAERVKVCLDAAQKDVLESGCVVSMMSRKQK